jgi:hypothetical protein
MTQIILSTFSRGLKFLQCIIALLWSPLSSVHINDVNEKKEKKSLQLTIFLLFHEVIFEELFGKERNKRLIFLINTEAPLWAALLSQCF